MKFSIITITYGDGAKLDRTLHSVYRQQLMPGDTVEHIIVDSNPTIPPALSAYSSRPGVKILRTPPCGVYAAINEGLKAAEGDIIALLHGSDYYPTDNILARVAGSFSTGDVDFVYGNVDFVEGTVVTRVLGTYNVDGYKPEYLTRGFAPPHPALFISRRVKDSLGPYREDYAIAADFDYFIRLFSNQACFKGTHIPESLVAMDAHGRSRTLYARLVTNTLEKRRALRENGYRISWPRLMQRYLLHFKKFRR